MDGPDGGPHLLFGTDPFHVALVKYEVDFR